MFRRVPICAAALLITASALVAGGVNAANVIPACRIDEQASRALHPTLQAAASAYAALGKPLLFDTLEWNPRKAVNDSRTLTAYVVTDAARDGVTPQGCAMRRPQRDEPLDALSVREGCVVVAVDRKELRCSADAVSLFADIGKKPGRANPTLLYVIAHELGHIYQRRAGEYAGRAESLSLRGDAHTKLKQLQTYCDPALITREEGADTMALKVLTALLPKPPYREPLFSEQGSVFWSIDQINLTINQWQQAAIEREFVSPSKVHAAFVATEFPTPKAAIERNATQFVCDALTKTKGEISFPAKSSTHPPLVQRVRRIAEALKPIALGLPLSGGTQEFRSVATLQEQLSPIFTHIYRENAAYLDALHSRICTRVNSDSPLKGCK